MTVKALGASAAVEFEGNSSTIYERSAPDITTSAASNRK